MFTVHSLEASCAANSRPVGIRVEPDTLNLKIGEEWSVEDLVVEVEDETGQLIPQVPLSFALEGSLQSFETRGANARITAIAPGEGVLTVMSACEHSIATRILVKVLR